MPILASSAWLESFGFFSKGHPGILLVILGVAGEIIFEWTREKTWKSRMVKFFGIILIAGLLLEVREAVEADNQAAHLTQDNLLLRSNVVALELRLKPRVLTAQQVTNFVFLTEHISKIPIRILVERPSGDVISYATQIRAMFTKAGFGEDPDANLGGVFVASTKFLVRPIGSDEEWPDVVFLYLGNTNLPSSETFQIPSELLNGSRRPITASRDPIEVSHALGTVFAQMGITLKMRNDPDWVKPGDFTLLVMPK